MAFDPGNYVVRCIRPGGHVEALFDGKAFEEGEELDLLALDTPDVIRCGDYETAERLCSQPGLPLADGISAGHFVVVRTRYPELPHGH